jgi:hypothetical protein
MDKESTASRRLTKCERLVLRLKVWILNAVVFILDGLISLFEPKPTPAPLPQRRYRKRHGNLRLVPKSEADKESEPYWPRKSKAKLRLVK